MFIPAAEILPGEEAPHHHRGPVVEAAELEVREVQAPAGLIPPVLGVAAEAEVAVFVGPAVHLVPLL